MIIVIGDSHVGLADGSETRMIAWIDRLDAKRPSALVLNGDLFHYLIAHRNFRTASVDRVFERLRKLRDSGVAVHFVEGNRDFFLRKSFVEDAVTSIGDEYPIAAGKKKYLIVHGDRINDSDWPYRFWRRASKNPISKLGVNLIPKKTARRFVDSVEARLARSNFKHKSQLPIEMMKEYGRKRAAEGFTDIILGHFHEKVVIPADGATVTVLPPWYETGEAMAIDEATGASEFIVL